MISIVEYVTPNRGIYKPINPNNLTKGNSPVRRATLSQAVPSIPNKSQMAGVPGLEQMRKNQNVSPTFGTRMPATAYKMMGRKAPPGTAFANVPNVPLRR